MIETDYDDSGREEHRRVTTIDADFNSDVLRISMTFDTLGRVATVSQYASATVGVGSPLDQVKYTYDGWGNLQNFEQDIDSAVGSGTPNDYELQYTHEKSIDGRRSTRVATVEYIYVTTPARRTITYQYLAADGRHDDELSRVTRVRLGATDIVGAYAYTGTSWVVGQDYPEPDVMWLMYEDGTMGSYPDLDRFNRVTSSRWTSDLGTDIDFYDVDVSYDENSNITVVEDNVHAGFDASYTNDDLNRLTLADEGTWNGSSITSRTRQQNWTLDQVGNWDLAQLDLDGDLNYNETNEYNDDRTHNVVNELTGRDTDDSGADDYTLSYDEVGNLIDDGKSYKYVYDAFGRLCSVLDRTDDSEVALYTYNGLGYRKSFQHDTDLDGDADALDPTYNLMYDERWRLIATFFEDDDFPKEYFVNHNAGLDGSGASSYIDLVILREKDANTAWTASSDDVLEERTYYLQNWRADVVALITDTAQMIEWTKYSAYGIPFGLPAGDTDSDGDCDGTDVTQIQTWIDAPTYDVRGDLDLDGDVDATDKSIAQNTYQGRTSGWNVLSDSAVANRKGYAGYEQDAVLTDLHHVRHRVYSAELGRWTRRDPLGYVDGMNLYEYVQSRPVEAMDPAGLWMNCAPRIYTCPCTDLRNAHQHVYNTTGWVGVRALSYDAITKGHDGTTGPGRAVEISVVARFYGYNPFDTHTVAAHAAVSVDVIGEYPDCKIAYNKNGDIGQHSSGNGAVSVYVDAVIKDISDKTIQVSWQVSAAGRSAFWGGIEFEYSVKGMKLKATGAGLSLGLFGMDSYIVTIDPDLPPTSKAVYGDPPCCR